MKLTSIVLTLLCLCAVADEPVKTDADIEALRVFAEQGQDALTPVQLHRVKFWFMYEHYQTNITRAYSGMIFGDDFEGEELSLFQWIEEQPDGKNKLITGDGNWRVWNSDNGIDIAQRNGRLEIKGTSTHGPGLNFNGLVGKVFPDTDVIAVADMMAAQPPEDLPGVHWSMVHLCGSVPDYFHELCFGRGPNDYVGWTHHYAASYLPNKRPMLGVPAQGDERKRMVPLKLEHEGDTQLSRAWFEKDGQWHQVGNALPVALSSSKVELKVNVPTMDAPVESYFDNCRVYGRPQTHPVRFLLNEGQLGEVELSDILVEVLIDGKLAASGRTGGLGTIALTLPSKYTYPQAATVRLTLSDGTHWEDTIECDGLSGLYPGDSYAINLNARELAGDDDWWKFMHRFMLDTIEKEEAKAE